MQMTAEADGTKSKMFAEAEGLIEILKNKADGFASIIQACNADSEQAAMLLITDQLPKLVEEQVKAIANLKIDKVTVWENGTGGDGKSSTADFISSLVGSLPPLHELTRNVGVKMPDYLGSTADDAGTQMTPPPADGSE